MHEYYMLNGLEALMNAKCSLCDLGKDPTGSVFGSKYLRGFNSKIIWLMRINIFYLV
jgi:hypothetical protein